MNSASSHPAPVFPRPGSSLDYALSTAPPGTRGAVRAWALWWHETAQIPLSVSDPGVAETKLRWWQQEIKEASRGHAHHPVVQALLAAEAVRPPSRLPGWPCWQSQIDGLIDLVHQTRWLDEASLLRHAGQTTGQACAGAAALLGAGSEAAMAAAHRIGVGLRLAHQLARLGQDARAGWVHVAIDVLQQHEVRAHQLSKPDPSGPPAGLSHLLTHLRHKAVAELQAGRSAWRALPSVERRALRPLLVLAHIHVTQMNEIVRQGDRVLHERIVLTPLRKWWIAQRVRWGWLR